jgi:hypothetical protein
MALVLTDSRDRSVAQTVAPSRPLPEYAFRMPLAPTDVLAIYFERGWNMRFSFAADVSAAEVFAPNAFLPVIAEAAEAKCQSVFGLSLQPVFEADPNAFFNVRVALPEHLGATGLMMLVSTASEIFQPREGETRELEPLFKFLLTPPEDRGELTEPLW